MVSGYKKISIDGPHTKWIKTLRLDYVQDTQQFRLQVSKMIQIEDTCHIYRKKREAVTSGLVAEGGHQI